MVCRQGGSWLPGTPSPLSGFKREWASLCSAIMRALLGAGAYIKCTLSTTFNGLDRSARLDQQLTAATVIPLLYYVYMVTQTVCETITESCECICTLKRFKTLLASTYHAWDEGDSQYCTQTMCKFSEASKLKLGDAWKETLPWPHSRFTIRSIPSIFCNMVKNLSYWLGSCSILVNARVTSSFSVGCSITFNHISCIYCAVRASRAPGVPLSDLVMLPRLLQTRS